MHMQDVQASQRKTLLKPGEKAKFPRVWSGATQTLCTSGHVNYSRPVLHVFHCLT